jgi:hypothetical protein
MQIQVRALLVAAGGVAVAGLLALGTLPSASQTADAPKAVPRVNGKPNFTGLWQALTEANWDIQAHEARPGPAQFGALFSEPASVGIVEGSEIPYQPWALARKREHFARRWALDPETKCYLPGVPRATYMPHPFQIIQGDDKVLIAYAFASASRLIPLGEGGESPAESWMGWSQGRWDGDVLVVEVNSFNDQTWFDRAGNFHSEALTVVERYRLASADVIQYEATITDPKVFTRPWKLSLPLYRRLERNAQLLEFKCIPFSEELIYGHLRKKTN